MKDYEDEPTQEIQISSEEQEAIEALIDSLRDANSVEEYQSSVFNVSKKMKLKPRNLFTIIYQILLGRPQGPRFGPYVELVGKKTVIEDLERVLNE